MNKEEFYQLIDKYLSGKAGLEEEQQLLNFFQSFQNSSGWDERTMGIREELEQKMLGRLMNSVRNEQEEKLPKVISLRSWKLIAAAVAVFSISFALYFIFQKGEIPSEKAIAVQFKNDIPPGGNKAVLTLADGSQIILDNAEEGVLASQGQTAVSKTRDGQLVYDASAEKLAAGSSSLAYNTITTPRGGQYMVILPDETKVWLNAASSLRFPTAFTKNERKVELTGEAYFEVAKMVKGNKAKGERLPFIVNSGEQQIEVLGTHFNVMAYEDEPAVKTTLLEGSVKVSHLTSHISYLLKPGQQSSMNRAGAIKAAEVNTEEAVAWKNGYFMFANENIQSIMNKISRWYDVEIEYQGDVKDKALWGTISRFENVSEVLKMMELTGIIHFKAEGRRITVMP